MTELAPIEVYGQLTEPATLRIQRLLPGPIERIWDYLTRSDMRRQWLASGEMELREDAPFEFVWRNGELSDVPGERPEGFSEEHRMKSRIVVVDPPHSLTFTWGASGEVSFQLETQGRQVLLTVIHRRLADRREMLSVSAGWHTHLDILAARLNGDRVQPYWDIWLRMREEYDRRLPV